MNEKAKAPETDEKVLLKLYMDLTGATESEARCVLMHTCYEEIAAAKPREVDESSETIPPRS
jgi:hypothetical protein